MRYNTVSTILDLLETPLTPNDDHSVVRWSRIHWVLEEAPTQALIGALLSSQRRYTKWLLIYTLGERGDIDAEATLKEFLNSSDVRIVSKSKEALGKIRNYQSNKLNAEKIIQWLEQPPEDWFEANYVLRVRVEIEAIIQALSKTNNPQTAYSLCYALGKKRSLDAIPLLASLLQNAVEDVQEEAGWAIVGIDPIFREDGTFQIPSHFSYSHFIDLLRHESILIRGAAALILSAFGLHEAKPHIEQALAKEESGSTQSCMNAALERLI